MTHRSHRDISLADRWVAAWMNAVMRLPRTALLALSGLCLLSLYGASGIGVNADSSRMLSPDLPDQKRAAELAEAFPLLKQYLLIVVWSDNSDAADLAVSSLVASLKEKTDVVSQVYAPAVDPFLISNGLLYQDVDEVESALTRLSASSNLLAKLRTDQTLNGFIEALDDARALARRAELGPEALDRLYGEAASVVNAHLAGQPRSFGWSSILADESEASRATRLITVTPNLDLTRLSPAKPALQAIQAAIASLPADQLADVQIGITGEPALRAEEMESVLGTIGLSLTISLVLVAMILWIGLRSRGRAMLAFASLAITLILTTGFAGAFIGDLNLVSVAFIVLMVGLGIDFAIHVLAHIEELRRHGSDPAEATIATGRRIGLALLLSAASTSLAFLAFGTTDFSGMAQLGALGCAGVLISCFVALTLTPAVIALKPELAGAPISENRAHRISFPVNRYLAPAIVLTFATAALWPAFSARFDADPMGLRNPDATSVSTFNLLARTPETSPYRASILAEGPDAAQEIAQRFANQQRIGSAIWLGDLVPARQDEKLDLLDIAAPSIEFAIAGVPTDLIQRDTGSGSVLEAFRGALTAQNADEATSGSQALENALSHYLKLQTAASDAELEASLFASFELLTDRLEAMLGADYITEESLPEEMRSRFVNADGIYRVEILPEANLRDPRELQAFAAKVSSIAETAAGGPIQLAAAGAAIGWAMLQATLLAALATGLLAWFATRRATDVIAILLPLAMAGILTAAASTLLNMPFNYANVIVLPLLIGIGVDSGIHIAMRERNAPQAVFQTSTPRAVVFSALTTMAAFGTLALSEHPGTASMGVLLTVAMTAAVLCVLAVTPTVIRWTRSNT